MQRQRTVEQLRGFRIALQHSRGVSRVFERFQVGGTGSERRSKPGGRILRTIQLGEGDGPVVENRTGAGVEL